MGSCWGKPAAEDPLIGVVSAGLVGALMAAGLTGATWAGVLGPCDSSVDDRCVRFCLSSVSLGVVAGAPVPVLEGVVLVPEPWWFMAGEDVGDAAVPGDEGLPSSCKPSTKRTHTHTHRQMDIGWSDYCRYDSLPYPILCSLEWGLGLRHRRRRKLPPTVPTTSANSSKKLISS